MNIKHLSIGLICFTVGLILAPTFTPEDLVTSVPLIAMFGAETYILIAIIGYILLVVGALLIARATLMHLGIVGREIVFHPVLIIITLILVFIFAYWYFTTY